MGAKKQKPHSNMPEGFEEVSGRVVGFFKVEEGNSIRGILTDSFTHKTKFGEKKVYKIEITADTEGGTRITDSDKNERGAEIGEVVGLDQKGWLKKLDSVGVGEEVYVECIGKEAASEAKKGQNAAWKFRVGVFKAR